MRAQSFLWINSLRARGLIDPHLVQNQIAFVNLPAILVRISIVPPWIQPFIILI
jgi:hypothetical protein